MLGALWSLGLSISLFLSEESLSPVGYLLPPCSGAESAVRQRPIAYVPREGDLIFFDDRSPLWTALFALAGSGPPLHMGIVVKTTAGALAVLEAGPDDTVWVELRDVVPRLHQFHRDFHGGITVRRCKVTLGPKQSAALTRFALAQKGKRYAILRLLAQGTPFRVRGPLEPFLAQTHLDQDAWICSELAVAAGTVVGLFDPRVVRANVTYPQDLVDNQRYNLRAVWHDPAEWRPAGFSAKFAASGKSTPARPTLPPAP
jgi:hypothetical protein